eukprot:jgi/Undpi1/6399/HiC_scaffold_20.g08880.m1
MTCVSCDICVYHLGLFVFLPRVFLSSRVAGACPVTTDLIMRVNTKRQRAGDKMTTLNKNTGVDSVDKDTLFHMKLDQIFPGSILEGQLVSKAAGVLKLAGFNAENSIALVGVCRDEICSPFVQHVVGQFGHTFGIRGLGGFISCGRTGFGAAHAHSPVVNGRRSYVYFVAPHIAIDEQGMVGLVSRPGIEAKSSACGALCAFRAEVESGDVDMKLKTEDIEQCLLKQALGPHLKKGNLGNVLCGSSYSIPSLEDLTKLASKVIVSQLEDHIKATVDTTIANYAIVAGIQIHGPEGKTYFCQVPEHCSTCVEGEVKPLVIDSYALEPTSPLA